MIKKWFVPMLGIVSLGSFLLLAKPAEQVWLPLVINKGLSTPVATVAQPVLPLRAAFYYPWYPDAWQQQGLDPFTHYHPTSGYYDSSDVAVVKRHIAAMQYGQIQAGIASWWGVDHHTDQRIPLLLDAARTTNFRWALYYEAEGQGDPSVAVIQRDLAYIRDHYIAHPTYLQLGGRPVLFVYGDVGDDCSTATRWNQANGDEFYLVLKVFQEFRSCVEQPQGWHQYAPATAESDQSGYSFSISPGFWLASADEPRLGRSLVQWQASIRAMIESNAPFQLITTFNEWGEGTAVEAATEWQSDTIYGRYLDKLHQDGKPARSATPVATATVLPTANNHGTIPGEPRPTLVVTPVADAYINGEKLTINYGDAVVLRTDITPTLRSYVRFQVPAFAAPLHRASVRLYAHSASSLGYEVRTLPLGSQWDESAITAANAPAVGYVIDSSGVVTADTWSSVDVTRFVHANSALELAVLNLNDTALSFASRETDTAPQLYIELDLGSPPTPPADAPVVLATGDIASCNSTGDEAVAALLQNLAGPILTLGDTVYESGTATEFANCFDPAWGPLKERIIPTVGNHEYLTRDAKPYFDYFGAAAGDPTQGYFSYDIGKWHIIVLNSNCAPAGGCQVGSPQSNWLRTDLERNRTHCTLAYFHHPRWSSGQYQINDKIRNLVELLYEYHVEIMLSGHAHSYERFAPQTPDGTLDPEHGLVQFVVGVGGKNHRRVDVNVLPNSKVRNDDTFGVLKLSLLPERYYWEFLSVQGTTFTDSGWAHCH